MFKNNLYAFVFFTCFWFLLVIVSGSLFSGYKFMDDAGHLVLTSKINQGQGAFELIKNYTTGDLQNRFRPLWAIEYAARTVLLKDNFLLHAIYRAFETVLICFFLFLFARKLGLGQRISTLFALLSTVGQQSIITWALAPSEGIGMFFLSLSLLFMAKAVLDDEKKLLNESLFLLFTALMSLCKESFIFFIPAIYTWRLWLSSRKYNISFIRAIRKNIFHAVVLAAIAIAELFTLISISTNFGYAGTDSSLGVSNYIKTFIFLLIFSITGLVSLIGFGLIFFKIRSGAKKWFYPLLLFSAIVFPQVIIYTKSGMLERYFLPAVLGYSMLLIHQVLILEKHPVNYLVNKTVAMLLSLVSSMVLACGLLLGLSSSIRTFIVKTMLGFRGEIVQEMNPLTMVIARSSNNIQVIGFGIALIGTCMVAGCIALIAFRIKTFRLYHAFMAIILISLALNTISVFGWARKFAKEGETVNSLLSSITRNTKPTDHILVVADTWVHLEASCSGLPSYLRLKTGRDNLYGQPVSLDGKNPASQADSVFYTIYKKYTPATPYPCIVFFPETEQLFAADTSLHFNTRLYNRAALNNGYVVYSLK